MFFFKKPKIIETPLLKIDNVDIERVARFNFLGIHINQNLTWTDHINTIAHKITKCLGILNRLKHFVPSNILLLIYNSLILSHINYGLLSWGYDSKKIFNLQKRAIRIIAKSRSKSHTDPLFKYLNLLKVKDLHFLKQAKFYFNLKNNKLPNYFMESFNQLLGHKEKPVYMTRLFS